MPIVDRLPAHSPPDATVVPGGVIRVGQAFFSCELPLRRDGGPWTSLVA